MKRIMTAIFLGATLAGAAGVMTSNMPPASVPQPIAEPFTGYVVGRPPAPPVPPELLLKLAAKDTTTIVNALNELDRYDTGTSTVWNALAGLLGHREPDVRLATIGAIEYLDNKESLVVPLATCMHDRNEDVREASCDVLGDIESKAALDFLVIHLTNRHEYIRDTCGGNLEFHTAESFDTPAEWRAWWSSNRVTFTF